MNEKIHRILSGAGASEALLDPETTRALASVLRRHGYLEPGPLERFTTWLCEPEGWNEFECGEPFIEHLDRQSHLYAALAGAAWRDSLDDVARAHLANLVENNRFMLEDMDDDEDYGAGHGRAQLSLIKGELAVAREQLEEVAELRRSMFHEYEGLDAYTTLPVICDLVRMNFWGVDEAPSVDDAIGAVMWCVEIFSSDSITEKIETLVAREAPLHVLEAMEAAEPMQTPHARALSDARRGVPEPLRHLTPRSLSYLDDEALIERFADFALAGAGDAFVSAAEAAGANISALEAHRTALAVLTGARPPEAADAPGVLAAIAALVQQREVPCASS